MTDYRKPTGAELHDAIRQQLPHCGFDLTVVYGYGIPGVNSNTRDGKDALVIRCRCGRRLDWPTGSHATLPMDILMYWLADHDDEMFLTEAERDAKYAQQIQRPITGPFGPFDPDGPFLQPPDGLRAQLYRDALIPTADGGRPLLYDPDNALHNGDPA